MAKSDSLGNLRTKRKATQKLVRRENNPAGKQKISETAKFFEKEGIKTFSELSINKASSCTKARRSAYKTKSVKDTVHFAKMPRKMKKQIKKELLATA